MPTKQDLGDFQGFFSKFLMSTPVVFDSGISPLEKIHTKRLT